MLSFILPQLSPEIHLGSDYSKSPNTKAFLQLLLLHISPLPDVFSLSRSPFILPNSHVDFSGQWQIVWIKYSQRGNMLTV